MEGPDQVLAADSYVSCDVRVPVKLRLSEQGVSSRTPISVPTMLRNTAERWPERSALCSKHHPDNNWHAISYSRYHQLARTAARAFISCGLAEFDGVALMGFNMAEYFIANMGAIMAGAVTTGMYTTSSASTCQFYLTNTRVTVVVVENEKYLQKVLAVRNNCPLVHTVVQYTGQPSTDGVLSWEQFLEKAEKCKEEVLEERLKSLAVNRCASIIYTSGTTGEPKGVMVSHDMFTWTATVGTKLHDFRDGQELMVSYLPLSHGAAQIVDMYAAMACACTVYFAKPDALKGSLIETLQEVRPTHLFGVPRIWEKMHEKLSAVFSEGGVRSGLINWCRHQALSYWLARQQNYNTWTPMSYFVFESVLRRIRQRLGLDRIRSAITGAAPISEDIVKFMLSLNVPLFEMYGLSETCGPSTFNKNELFKIGSIGKVFADCQIKIKDADDEGVGELLHYGRNVFMGYLNQPESTAATIAPDGWLLTGDLARIDSQGFAFIAGRLKELLITAGGKNIAPVPIEEAIKSELPIISNVMVIGDRRKFLSALFTAKVVCDRSSGEPTDQLAAESIKWLSEHEVAACTVPELLSSIDQVKPVIQRGVDSANAKADSQACWIKEWRFLPTDFSVAGGELGPTLKLRRQIVAEKYKDIVSDIYKN